MLNNLFDADELPNFKIYETAQNVVNDYKEKKCIKIDVVAAELETTRNVLYRQLNPSDTSMPLSADRIIAITKLTKDNRIIEALNNEFNLVGIAKEQTKVSNTDIKDLAIIAQLECNDVFNVVIEATKDNKITKEEQKNILKEIDDDPTCIFWG